MDPITFTALQFVLPLPFIAAGIVEREKQDAIINQTYPTVIQSWKKPEGFDKFAEMNACLVKHGHRINAANTGRTTYITVGEDSEKRLTLTVTRWPVEGDISNRVPTGKTNALQCVYEDGKLWNARISQFNGEWIAANLPQQPNF